MRAAAAEGPALDAEAFEAAEICVAAAQRFLETPYAAIVRDPGLSPEALAPLYRAAGAAERLLLVAPSAAPGILAGAACMALSGADAHLAQIDIDPVWQGRGAGSTLLAGAAAWARARGARRLTLTTFRDVPWNAPFYARRGFSPLPATLQSEATRAELAREAAKGYGPETRLAMARAL